MIEKATTVGGPGNDFNTAKKYMQDVLTPNDGLSPLGTAERSGASKPALSLHLPYCNSGTDTLGL